MEESTPLGRHRRGAHSFRRVWILAVAWIAAAGCSEQQPIVVEKVPKDPPPRSITAEAPVATDRMLAAILPLGESAYFFKLVGADRPVASQKAAFLDLVKSSRVEDGRLRWTSPKGWTERPASAMRLATLEVPGDPPLELSISTLPFQGERNPYLLSNINRWRGQMGLAPMEAADLHAGGDADEETTELALADGTKATLVNLKGRFESGGMTPPFAAGAGTRAEPVSAKPAAKSPLAYEVPTGWKELGADGISKASFSLGEGMSAARVTVTPLPASNDLLGNVNRWRGQVSLPPLAENQLGEATKPISLGDGEEGTYVELVSPDARTAILGVMAVRGDTAWFVKLGPAPAEIAQGERSGFESFVKSLRFSRDGE